MTDESQKLERFKKAVSDETDVEVEQMIAEAEKQSKEIVENARAASVRRSKLRLRELETQSEQRLRREVSAAKLDSQRRVLIKREQLADGVFEDVKRRLAEFRDSKAYTEWLAGAVKSCTAKYPGAKAEVCLAPADMKYADSLGVSVTEDCSIELGGVSVRFEEQGVVLDCTFDSMLERERADFCNNKEIGGEQ